jgi:hypothetical protein
MKKRKNPAAGISLSDNEMMNIHLMGVIQGLSLADKQDLLKFIIQRKALAQQLAENREAQRTANARPPQGSANAGGNQKE